MKSWFLADSSPLIILPYLCLPQEMGKWLFLDFSFKLLIQGVTTGKRAELLHSVLDSYILLHQSRIPELNLGGCAVILCPVMGICTVPSLPSRSLFEEFPVGIWNLTNCHCLIVCKSWGYLALSEGCECQMWWYSLHAQCCLEGCSHCPYSCFWVPRSYWRRAFSPHWALSLGYSNWGWHTHLFVVLSQVCCGQTLRPCVLGWQTLYL